MTVRQKKLSNARKAFYMAVAFLAIVISLLVLILMLGMSNQLPGSFPNPDTNRDIVSFFLLKYPLTICLIFYLFCSASINWISGISIRTPFCHYWKRIYPPISAHRQSPCWESSTTETCFTCSWLPMYRYIVGCHFERNFVKWWPLLRIRWTQKCHQRQWHSGKYAGFCSCD